VEAAKANNLANFSSYLERMLDELFIERMEGNEEIFSRVMTDKEFRSAAHEYLAREIFRRVRGAVNINYSGAGPCLNGLRFDGPDGPIFSQKTSGLGFTTQCLPNRPPSQGTRGPPGASASHRGSPETKGARRSAPQSHTSTLTASARSPARTSRGTRSFPRRSPRSPVTLAGAPRPTYGHFIRGSTPQSGITPSSSRPTMGRCLRPIWSPSDADDCAGDHRLLQHWTLL
jgi:type I restriction enzyme R subunit